MKSFKISNYDIGMPAILAGAGILTLIICMIVLIPGQEPPDENTALTDAVARMETRIAALESRLESTVAAPSAPTEIPNDALSEYEMHIQSITDQMAGIQRKIDYIDKRQGNLEQRVVGFTAAPPKRESSRKQAANSAPKQGSSRKQASAPKQTSAVKQTSAPKQAVASTAKKEIAAKQTTPSAVKKQAPAAKQAPAKSAKVHLVAAGETRYGIARQYGLSVAQLNAINGFSEQTVLQPGQKIVVQK